MNKELISQITDLLALGFPIETVGDIVSQAGNPVKPEYLQALAASDLFQRVVQMKRAKIEKRKNANR